MEGRLERRLAGRRLLRYISAVVVLAFIAAGCVGLRELVVEPNEMMCQMYGITREDIDRAVAGGSRNVQRPGMTVVKVLPDGTVIRLREVARLRYREREGH